MVRQMIDRLPTNTQLVPTLCLEVQQRGLLCIWGRWLRVWGVWLWTNGSPAATAKGHMV